MLGEKLGTGLETLNDKTAHQNCGNGLAGDTKSEGGDQRAAGNSVVGSLGTCNALHSAVTEFLLMLAEVSGAVIAHEAGDGGAGTRENADKVADDAWRYTRAYLKAMQQHPNNTIAELARSTYIHTFDKYGDIANMGEKDEYGAYKKLLGDLAAIPSDTLTTLALGPWVENMTLAQAKHEVLRNQRVNEDATYQTGLAKQARLDAEAAYRTFVEKLNALIIINGPEPYASFVNSINVVINELLTTMKANDTRNKNKKEDPTEPETPDTPETPESGTTTETSA